MDIFLRLFNEIELAVGKVLGTETDLKNVTVELPKDAAHGDFSSNAAMVLAKAAGYRPRDLAEKIVENLSESSIVSEVSVAGPGFLNFRLHSSVILETLQSIRAQAHNYGASNLGKGKRVNIEYVSANPTGPLHAGHMRGAILGDALARLLKIVGYEVTSEYYINDGGAQVDVLARSVYLRYLEAHGQEVQFPEGTYPGEYLVAAGEELKNQFGDQFLDAPESEWLATFREASTDAMMDLIREDLSSVNIEMDHYFSEKSLYKTGRIEAAIASLEEKSLIYTGTLPPPKGKELEDWEAREQRLFKSTLYGDDVDRPIQKADGEWTYFAPDIAYHYDKISRGFDQLIDILGADHGGYVKRMQAAVSALSDEKIDLDIKLCQLVKLFKNGEPFKMSKRAGNFVLLSDIVKEVGADVARFVVLMRKPDAPLDFDFDKVKEQSKDNPVFYVQYAHARAHSVLNRATAEHNLTDENADLTHLETEAELGIIKTLANYPRIVTQAAESHEPHRIAFYLYDLASEFHALQHQGKLDHSMRFIDAERPDVTRARLALVRSVQQVIANGLQILGVSPMNEMH